MLFFLLRRIPPLAATLQLLIIRYEVQVPYQRRKASDTTVPSQFPNKNIFELKPDLI